MSDCIYDIIIKKTVQKIKKENNISTKTEELLLQACDLLTITTVATAPQDFIDSNENPLTDADIETHEVDLGWRKIGKSYDSQWVRTNVKDVHHQISPHFSADVLGEDDLFTKYTCFEKFVGATLRNTVLFPMKDTAVYTDSDEILRDVKLGEGQAQPKSYNSNFDMQSDESFSRIFFYGMGATLLVAQDHSEAPRSDLGPFVVDIPLQDLEVRPGFRKYGCRIHFSKDQRVTGIHDYANNKTVKPGDDGWAQAKWLAKVNTFFLVTAREHLVWTHLLVSNTATKESIVRLPPNHPLRRLLTIFTYRSTEINTSAFDGLVPRYSLLHRSTALKYESMKTLFDSAYLSSNAFEPFPQRKISPDLMELVDQGKFPFVSQGIEYYRIVEGFVRDWISRAGESKIVDDFGRSFYEGMRRSSLGQKYVIPVYRSINDMVQLVSQIIFMVTAYHELVGNVVDYTSQVNRAGFRIANTDETTLDVQSLLMTAIIAASTSIRMPQLMADFPNFFSAGGAPAYEREVWNSFLEKLRKQSQKVQDADANREVEFRYFDPARFECSVSV